MFLPGSPGIATSLGLFALVWLIVFLRTRSSPFSFEPRGVDGEFGKELLPIYLDITKLMLGIAAGSIVLLVGSSNLIQQSGGRSLKTFASPMFMVAMSIVYGVLFMTLLVLRYEHHRHSPASTSYTRFKYTGNQALGFSALACFCIGYAWLVWMRPGSDMEVRRQKSGITRTCGINRAMAALDRRRFLQFSALAAVPLFPAPYSRMAAALRRKVKITDVKCMIVRGTWDWNLIKIETDAGLYGIGEAYWGPGVKDVIAKIFQPLLIGEDPLNVDKLYTKILMRNGGAGAIGGVTVEAASGIEIALWDLAGRILETPTVNLLGGRFRDRVRFYRTMQLPKQHVEDPAAWRDLVHQARAERWGWTAFKFQGDGIPRALDPQYREPGHDPYTRQLKAGDIRQIVRFMEVVREELGPDGEFAIDVHWRFDTRDAIDLAKALEKVRPMWLEDPVPPENPEAMAFVRRQSPVPICTGENLYTRQGFLKLIELQACDGVHIDVPKSGGLLESKRISDLADNYYIWTAAHNPASPVGTIASAHAAASMRNFRIHELANYIDWWPDLVIHEGPIWENGYLTIQDKPGYGIELNPDVARAHLAPGETWWG